MRFAIYILIIILMGCQTYPYAKGPLPENTKNSLLCITVDLGLSGSYLKNLYFIKLKNKYDNAFDKTEILKSNYNIGEKPWGDTVRQHFFLMNAEPGFYAAVAVSGDREVNWDHFRETYYFPENMIVKSIIEVKANEMSYMGKFMGQSKGISSYFKTTKSFEQTQKHYYKVLNSFHANHSTAVKLILDKNEEHIDIRMVYHKSDIQIQNEFSKKMLKYLPDSTWKELFTKRLNELNAGNIK